MFGLRSPSQPPPATPAPPSSLTLWDEPLPPEERDALLDKAARFVVGRGLEAATIWALEMHKPLAFLGAQGLIVGGPMFGPLVGLERMQSLQRLLAEDGNVERLIARIEELSVSRDAAEASAASEASEASTRSDDPVRPPSF